jgi:hypothetical protein
MPGGGRFSTEYFLIHIMDLLLPKVFPEGKKCHALRVSVHLDNCQIHPSNASKQFVGENSLVAVLHPPHSPDLAPADFWLCGHIKTSLADRVFNDGDELLEPVTEFLNEIQPSEMRLVWCH